MMSARHFMSAGICAWCTRSRRTKSSPYDSEHAPAAIGGEQVKQVSTLDGVKYIMSDDSWLLIRPSGTEPVLRVYAEGRSTGMVKALLGYGEELATVILT
jgi:phosphomannomutase